MKNPARSVSATKVKNRFGDYLSGVIRQKEPLLIEKHGKPAAVLVDAEKWGNLLEASAAKPKHPWTEAYEDFLKRASRSASKKPARKGRTGLDLLRELREEEV